MTEHICPHCGTDERIHENYAKALRDAQRLRDAEEERDRYYSALSRIRNLDYRGNRHRSADIAAAALRGEDE